jgi:Dipeptidyl peptidase IV (DPP IV) N-terminal region
VIYLTIFQAGTTNPTIALFIVDLDAPSNKRILPVPLDIVTDEHILGTVFWINDQSLGAIWMNRRQNRGVFVAYDATTLAMSQVNMVKSSFTLTENNFIFHL